MPLGRRDWQAGEGGDGDTARAPGLRTGAVLRVVYVPPGNLDGLPRLPMSVAASSPLHFAGAEMPDAEPEARL